MINQDDAWRVARKLEAEIRSGRRHDIAIIRIEGRRVAQFGISRGSREQSHDYIHRQLFLSSKQCLDLCACPLSQADYIEILRRKGLLA